MALPVNSKEFAALSPPNSAAAWSALMARPRLLCMDEPSMGLSPAFVDQVFEIIQAINKQGTTIFVVEQNAAMALSIANRGYVLQTGEVVLSGSAKSLLENPMVQQAYLGQMLE